MSFIRVARSPMGRIPQSLVERQSALPINLVPKVWNDLRQDGLVDTIEQRVNETGHGEETHTAGVTTFGEAFLAFIVEPTSSLSTSGEG